MFSTLKLILFQLGELFRGTFVSCGNDTYMRNAGKFSVSQPEEI